VERIAAIHDVGRIINPLGAQSQVEGGIIQGIGHTLSEERLLDPQSGATLTLTLDSYKLPTIADVPEIVCEFVDKPDEHLTNLGSKGLGEPPIVPTAAAIANAIRDATGADIHSLPITREEMLRALREGARPRHRRSRGRWARSAETCCKRPGAGTGGSSFRATPTAATCAKPRPGNTASTRSSATSAVRRRIRPTRPRRCWHWTRV